MERWLTVALLSAGGVLGVNARYWLGVWINRWSDPGFPWATFLINVTGCFVVGLATVLLSRWLPHAQARVLVVTGFLGGYTTYSAFALESVMMWERGARGLSLGYMAGTAVAGFTAVVLGMLAGRGLSEVVERGSDGVVEARREARE